MKPEDTLTYAELAVAGLVAGGMDNAEIAQLLGITVGTVQQHVSAVYVKVGVDNRVRLTLWVQARYPTPEALRQALRPLRHLARIGSDGERRAVLCAAVIRGATDAEIAAERGLSERSVRSYISRLYGITGTRTREELARYLAARDAANPASKFTARFTWNGGVASRRKSVQFQRRIPAVSGCSFSEVRGGPC